MTEKLFHPITISLKGCTVKKYPSDRQYPDRDLGEGVSEHGISSVFLGCWDTSLQGFNLVFFEPNARVRMNFWMSMRDARDIRKALDDVLNEADSR